VRWPEQPTCHGEPSVWLPPAPNYRARCECGFEQVGPYGYPFRMCSRCASISAEDLVYWLQQSRHEDACRRCAAERQMQDAPGDLAGRRELEFWRHHVADRFAPHTCGVLLDGTAWRFGKPRKFFVHGIPNPYAGQIVELNCVSDVFDHMPNAEDMGELLSRIPGTQIVMMLRRWPTRLWRACAHARGPAPPTSFAKFYAEHLDDEGYDDEAREMALDLIDARSRVVYTLERGGSRYTAASDLRESMSG